MRALPGVKNYKCMNIKVGDFWKRNVFGLNRYDKSLQKSWHTTRLFENSNFAVEMPPLGRSICDLWLETKNGMAWLWLGEMGRKTGNRTGEGWGEGAREEGRAGAKRPTHRCSDACLPVYPSAWVNVITRHMRWEMNETNVSQSRFYVPHPLTRRNRKLSDCLD